RAGDAPGPGRFGGAGPVGEGPPDAVEPFRLQPDVDRRFLRGPGAGGDEEKDHDREAGALHDGSRMYSPRPVRAGEGEGATLFLGAAQLVRLDHAAEDLAFPVRLVDGPALDGPAALADDVRPAVVV